MKKLFGRKQPQTQHAQPPLQTRPISQSTPTPSGPPPVPKHGTQRSLPPIPPLANPPERQDSLASFQSLPQSSPVPRSSFQLQQQHPPHSATLSSTGTKTSLDGDGAWIVVEPNTLPTQTPVTAAAAGGGSDHGFVRTQPSFESRSSSLASLPPGASPPLSYPQPQQQQQQQPQYDPPPPKPHGTRRLQSRKLSDASGLRHSTPNGTTGSIARHSINGLASTENLSIMSHSQDRPDKEKHKRGFLDWLGGDKERIARERTAVRALSPDPTGAAQPGQPWDLTRIMGFVTATASEDWTLLMEVCDRASTDSGAKEAAKALKSEIKYADAPAMLSAARLWAIMLRNTKSPFLAATSSKKFLEAVEDTYNEPDTSPVVRDRLQTVVAGASFQFGEKYSGFRSLWKRIKPPTAPIEGIPFDPKDAMFSPPSRRLPKPGPPQDPAVRPPAGTEILTGPPGVTLQSPQGQMLPPQGLGIQVPPSVEKERRPKNRSHRSSRMGIISPEEDIRRLFEECEIAKANAGLLSNAMTYAKPEDVASGGQGGLIAEFHSKCMRSQELVSAQIPWASAQAERARAQYLQMHPETVDSSDAYTVEEELLAELLQANQELVEAFRIYDDLERLAVLEKEEKEVQERSRAETRLDRTQIQYYNSDGSFMTQPLGGAAGSGPSRSPSPAPGMLPHPSPSLNPRLGHPLPTPPSHHAHPSNGSSHTLAPPPPPPHGPRTRSRSPSPEGQSRRSIDTSRPPSTNGYVNGHAVAASGGRLDSLKRGMSKLGLDVRARNRSRSNASQTNPDLKGRRSGEVPDGTGLDDDDPRTPVQPSAKALGKRKADPPPEEQFDPDDIFKDPRAVTPLGLPEENLLNSDSDSTDDPMHPHVVFAYDAAAERQKAWLKEALAVLPQRVASN